MPTISAQASGHRLHTEHPSSISRLSFSIPRQTHIHCITLTADKVERIVLSLQNLPEKVCDREMCTKWDIEILQVTVTCGDRSATFTVDPALATAQRFCFRNAFNVWEIAELSCAMTHKLAVDRSTTFTPNGKSNPHHHRPTHIE